jgi:small subunit ribosomal protein S16
VAVKIRLKRMGKIRAPYYRIVVADSRTKRDGRVIEEIGKYHPTEEPSFIEVNSERAQYWLGVGAQPTEQVAAILKLTGDWGKFKGDAKAVSTVKVKEPKEAFVADEKKKPRSPQAEEGRGSGQEGRGSCRVRSRRDRRLPPRPRLLPTPTRPSPLLAAAL